MAKKRLLFVGESSFLATGFSTYWNEVISRIFSTDEFEIAELGSYSNPTDNRIASVPWKFYPVMPHPNDNRGNEIYKLLPTNQFGEWIFDDVCLDWKPDIVLAIRDWWMDEFIERSSYRKYFKFLHMPTVDGSPQKPKWLDTYQRCDKIFTYSDWGKKILEKESGGKINVIDTLSPGVDIDTFKPVADKKQHKINVGIPGDAFIVGTTMRNQPRKLFYDLIEAFAQWLCDSSRGKYEHIAQKTFLYLHTSYPDAGYDIEKAIVEFGVGKKILMTYVCSNCGVSYPSFFTGGWSRCRNPKCSAMTAHPPNPNHFVSRQILSDIYNLFDIYVQYSICEGYGMPILEAKACGIPTMCVNYSAMEDHVNSVGGIPINVERFYYESMHQTEQRRALPSNEHFCQQLRLFLKKSEQERSRISDKIRQYVVEPIDTPGCNTKLPRCGWDRTAAMWAYHIRNTDIKNRYMTWDNPIPNIHKLNIDVDINKLSNSEFIEWAIDNVVHKPELKNSCWANDWIKALGYGFTFEGGQRVNVDKNYAMKIFVNMLNHQNNMEIKRVSMNAPKDYSRIKIAEL